VADFNQFGSVKPGPAGSDPQHCAQCEAMLTDALDGVLSPADQATFDLHLVGCPSCADMLADAQRGAAWMEMLHSPRPEPPTDLLERILAQTSGQAATQSSREALDSGRLPHSAPPPNTLLGRPILVRPSAAPASAFLPSSKVLPFRARLTYGLRSLGHTMLQPRLAMTAAMAFFSIALTLNLVGVHVSQLRASDFKPSSILRSCYEAKAKVVRYSDNLRVVYELESRVRDLQHSPDDGGQAPIPQTQTPQTQTPQNDPAAQPGQKPSTTQPDGQTPGKKESRPRPNPGSSLRETPGGSIRQVGSFQRLYGLRTDVAFVVLTPRGNKQEGGLV
jgi:hypothetical protein